jgi:hypothetical protein
LEANKENTHGIPLLISFKIIFTKTKSDRKIKTGLRIKIMVIQIGEEKGSGREVNQ